MMSIMLEPTDIPFESLAPRLAASMIKTVMHGPSFAIAVIHRM